MNFISITEAAKFFTGQNIISAVFSKPVKKQNPCKKVKIRKILIKNIFQFQMERFENLKVFHENIPEKDFLIYAEKLFSEFKNIESKTQDKRFIFMQNNKGNIKLLEKDYKEKETIILEHDKPKSYLLPISPPPEFLKKLNFFTDDEKIINNKYHKFRQINKYLEFIESIEPILLKIISKKKELNIIDFGCGKTYLSFALYYYLNEIKHIPSQIYGLDLKKDVIEFCNNLAQTCNFSNLNFKTGDIGNFKFNTEPDMVISLHACDTATDFALAKAVKSNAKIIFAVPCCQHELNTQIRQNKQKIRQSAFFSSLLDYGIITEKFSSLLTDTLRAKYLEASGYKVNIEEFIDTEHTPKNILIKAVKINTIKSEIIEKSKREIAEIIKTFSLTPVLEKLL
ncbi:SAM-dependent methyltransferase [Treponema pedis]|uniref:class I SAM-dependent methyltransferase n=1 Tax=Treponema pedis TaxID=409322 RepID=UPI003133E1EC